MPYIIQDQRNSLDPVINDLIMALDGHRANIGDVNYVITKVLLGTLLVSARYDDYNAAIGVLQCAMMELYRRAIVPYEDFKITQNGDVYGYGD